MMTWLILQVLGLLSTWLIYSNYQWIVPVVDALNEQQRIEQQALLDEYERNHQAEQEQIIIDDYFIFAKKIGKIIYARGCAGWYEKPTLWVDWKYHNCNKKAFDCWWAMKAYLIAKWIINKSEASLFNSQTLYELWTPKNPQLWKRWDFMYRRWFGDVASGNLSTHFAMLARDYTGGNIMIIFDQVNPGGTPRFIERDISVYCNSTMCHYMGKYRLYIASNWALELASKRDVEVTPRYDTTPESTGEVLMSVVPWTEKVDGTGQITEETVNNSNAEIVETMHGTATRYSYGIKWASHLSDIKSTCAFNFQKKDYSTREVCNVDTKKCIQCYNNDWMRWTWALIDLSNYAFNLLAPLSKWVIQVTIRKIK